MSDRLARLVASPLRLFALALSLIVALAVAAVAPARARGDEALVVRVLSERAEVRTGPSFTFRAIYTASRGEILQALDRAPRDYWFRVQLPDGTFGWILGDEVLPLAVDASAPPPPGWGSRFVAAVFSPPPLLTSDVGLAFSAGLLGGEGLALFRPSIVLAPALSLEGSFGETVGEQTDTLHYGLAANLYLWPSSPVTPFFSMGGGGARARKKVDQPVLTPGHHAVANVGLGLLCALKKRVTLRFDAREHALFDPNQIRTSREYSGGLVVLF
jgi:hypothetical protein